MESSVPLKAKFNITVLLETRGTACHAESITVSQEAGRSQRRPRPQPSLGFLWEKQGRTGQGNVWIVWIIPVDFGAQGLSLGVYYLALE